MKKVFSVILALCLLIGLSLPVGAMPGRALDTMNGATLSQGLGVGGESPQGVTDQIVTDAASLWAYNPSLSNLNYPNGMLWAANSTSSSAILKSVTLRSGSGSSSAVIASCSSLSGTSSSTITVPSSYSSTTSAYISWELADGAKLQSITTPATWNGAAISSNTQKTLPGSSNSSTLILHITASNGQNYTATITIKRTTGTSNTLSALYIKNRVTSSTSDSYLYELDRTFSSSTTSYTVVVPSSDDTIYFYYDTTHSDASVSLSGGYKRTSRSGYYEVDLDSGANTLTMKVTYDGSSTTYTVYVEREDDVVKSASLDSLSVRKTSSSSGTQYTLSPSFAYSRTSYDVDLDKSISEVYLHFTANRSSASVTVSGTGVSKVSDGVYKVTLVSGKTRTATIKVSYSGDATSYTIDLNSGGSTKAALRNLIVSSKESTGSSAQYNLLPSFDSSVFDYLVMIPYDKNLEQVYLRPTLDDTDDTLKVNNSTYSSGDWVSINLSPGDDTKVSLKVTDSNNKTSTYTVTIVAAGKNADNDARLSSLDVRTGSSSSSNLTLSPSFSKDTTSYTATVKNSQESLRVYATANDSDARILVNDVFMTDDYIEVPLSDGKNSIKVEVYAQDAETSKTYTVTVTRETDTSSSKLDGLELRTGSSQMISLIPAFSGNTLNYRATVPGDVTQISMRASANDNQATITIKGQTVYSGQWTNYYSLNPGENSFLVTVTSDGGTTSYTVVIECGLTVVVSNQSMRVNTQNVNSAAYNINGNNYFKLRDIAYALRGTGKHFEVTYDEATRVIKITSGFDYNIIGGEMTSAGTPKLTMLSDQRVMINSVICNIQAYNIDGYNYFMLRDIGQQLNFGITYDETTRTMKVDTAAVYTP